MFPRICCGCEQRIPEPRRILCEDCEKGFEPLRLPICDTCGCPDAQLKGAGRCNDCPGSYIAFEKARGSVAFAGTARLVVEKLKYQGRLEYAALMARHMFNTVLNQFSEVAYDSIVPVPLHSARLRERGFNQSRELARHLSEFSGVPVASALVRTRPTPSQTRLNRRERARNIAGAFDVAKTANPLNHCLVVDDVYTTGATLNECAGVLRNAGATSIHCIAFARAIL